MTSRVALVARKEGAIEVGAKFRQTLLSNWGCTCPQGNGPDKGMRKRSGGEKERQAWWREYGGSTDPPTGDVPF